MAQPAASGTPPVTLTPAAVEHLRRIMAENGLEGAGLRFGIRDGGCSGYSYILEFESAPHEGDEVFEFEGIPLFVAPLKRDFIQGCVIDYVDELLETGFKIRNPNVKRTCGCGESFEIDEAASA